MRLHSRSQLLKSLLVLNVLVISGRPCRGLIIYLFATIPVETATTNSSSVCADSVDQQRLAEENPTEFPSVSKS